MIKCEFNFNTQFLHIVTESSQRCNLLSKVRCLRYNHRINMTVCFNNVSRYSIAFCKCFNTGLKILKQQPDYNTMLFNLQDTMQIICLLLNVRKLW